MFISLINCILNYLWNGYEYKLIYFLHLGVSSQCESKLEKETTTLKIKILL